MRRPSLNLLLVILFIVQYPLLAKGVTTVTSNSEVD